MKIKNKGLNLRGYLSVSTPLSLIGVWKSTQIIVKVMKVITFAHFCTYFQFDTFGGIYTPASIQRTNTNKQHK